MSWKYLMFMARPSGRRDDCGSCRPPARTLVNRNSVFPFSHRSCNRHRASLIILPLEPAAEGTNQRQSDCSMYRLTSHCVGVAFRPWKDGRWSDVRYESLSVGNLSFMLRMARRSTVSRYSFFAWLFRGRVTGLVSFGLHYHPSPDKPVHMLTPCRDGFSESAVAWRD